MGLDWGTYLPWEGVILRGKGLPVVKDSALCHDLCKYGYTDRFAIWVVDSGGPMEAEI